MESSLEGGVNNPTEKDLELLGTFVVDEEKLHVILDQDIDEVNSSIRRLINAGYLKDIDTLHHPDSRSWKLRRIK